MSTAGGLGLEYPLPLLRRDHAYVLFDFELGGANQESFRLVGSQARTPAGYSSRQRQITCKHEENENANPPRPSFHRIQKFVS